MKLNIFILLLVLSTLLIGCANQPPVDKDEVEPVEEITEEEEALTEIDNSLIAEDDEIEIGEMI